ncbi:MAG: hypothetical protein K0S44_3003 [Bacteroidetes bacterium]|jgi:dihydroflavonol-4-reductase|nr:hypothetical protein [Bacteroidota bacterium]
MKNKIVVTGASGHIGFHVAKQLLLLGHQITLLIRSENQNINELLVLGAEIFIADLSQASSYQTLFSETDVLFHLASENTTNTFREKEIIDNTFTLSKTVLDAALAEKVKTIVYTSSVVVLGRSGDPEILITEKDKVTFPESPYVKGKLLAEQYCEVLIKAGADIRRIYPSWVIGPNDLRLTPPHKVVKDYLEKGQAFYFDGGISITAVEDVAGAHVNAWLKGKPAEQYITAGNNITFRQFYATLAKLSQRKAPSLFIPKWFLQIASYGAKLILGKKSPVAPEYVHAVVGKYSWYDSSKAIRELDYSITPAETILNTAIKETKKRAAGVNTLIKKHQSKLIRKQYTSDDVLLITGFPGWLGNRMLDIFMNGDRFGKNAIDRKIRLLVQPRFKGLIELPDNFEIVYGDITDKASLGIALKNVKCVYHLAGVIYPKKISSLYKVNEEGTKNLVDACIENGVPRILFMSTDSICGYTNEKRLFTSDEAPKPYKNYGKSKYLAEKYILDKTKEGLINGTSLRGFWFFGPFMPERNLSFFRIFRWKRQLVFGDGKNYRSVSHTDNIVGAFLGAETTQETKGKWYWIGNKTNDFTVDYIYKTIAEGLGVRYKPLYISPYICNLLSILDSFISLGGTVNSTIHAAGKFHRNIAGDISSAEKDFGYEPEVGFEEIRTELKEILKK